MASIVASVVVAQNPIIRDQYSADPTARIAVKAGGKLVAMVDIPKTTEWRKVRVKVKQDPKGINDVSVSLLKGINAEIDYIGFDTYSERE